MSLPRVWCADTGLGRLLKQQLKAAKKEGEIQDEIYEQFTAKLKPDNVKTWIDEVVAWEKDPSLPDPYYRGQVGKCSLHRRCTTS